MLVTTLLYGLGLVITPTLASAAPTVSFGKLVADVDGLVKMVTSIDSDVKNVNVASGATTAPSKIANDITALYNAINGIITNDKSAPTAGLDANEEQLTDAADQLDSALSQFIDDLLDKKKVLNELNQGSGIDSALGGLANSYEMLLEFLATKLKNGDEKDALLETGEDTVNEIKDAQQEYRPTTVSKTKRGHTRRAAVPFSKVVSDIAELVEVVNSIDSEVKKINIATGATTAPNKTATDLQDLYNQIYELIVADQGAPAQSKDAYEEQLSGVFDQLVNAIVQLANDLLDKEKDLNELNQGGAIESALGNLVYNFEKLITFLTSLVKDGDEKGAIEDPGAEAEGMLQEVKNEYAPTAAKAKKTRKERRAQRP